MPCLLRPAQIVVGSSPELPSLLVDMSAGTWIKRLGCHTDLYTQLADAPSEVHLRITQERKHAKGSTLALKPRADVTRSSKQGHQWPHKKDLRPLKKKF